MTKDRLLYATPTGKHPHPGYVTSMRQIDMSIRSFERKTEDFGFWTGPVQMARSQIAESAMDSGYDYLLMHDDDLMLTPTALNPVDVWHDLMTADPSIGMIGAVYLRERPVIPTVVLPHPEYPEENCHVVAGLTDRPFAVSGVGTGFVLIRVSAIRQLYEAEDSEPPFRFTVGRNRWGRPKAMGEDYDFCARLRGQGFKVLADPHFPTTHIKDTGRYEYEHAAWEAQWKPDRPDILERCIDLKSRCQPKMELAMIGGMLCIDHVPQIIAELEEAAAKRQKEAA